MEKNKKSIKNEANSFRFTSFRLVPSQIEIPSLGFQSLDEIPESATISFLPVFPNDLPLSGLEISESIRFSPGSEETTKNIECYSNESSDVVARLISNPDFLPLDDQLKDDLASILAGMPFEFRQQAKEKYKEGFLIFAKLPVFIEFWTTKKGRITGSPRPIECPEPPPEGSKFILAWKNGDLWDWELSFPYTDTSSSPLIDAAKYVRILRHLSSADDDSLRHLSKSILDRLPRNLETISDEKDYALLAAFEAGVRFSRSILYRNANRDAAAYQKRSNSRWPEIIRAALLRHGVDTVPDKLAKLLGLGPKPGEEIAARGQQRLESIWPFAPKNELTLNEFRQKVKQARDSLGLPNQQKKGNSN